MMKKVFITSLLCIFTLTVFAQRKADVTVPFDEDIQTILLNPFTGSVIVKQKSGVSSYNPETNQTDWKVTKEEIGKASAIATAQRTLDALSSPDLLKIFESNEEINFITESPFIRVIIDDRDVIINSMDGKIVFNSGSKDYRIVEGDFIPETSSFLFTATNGKTINCIWYDLQSGEEKWITELGSMDGIMKQFKNLVSFKNTATENKTELSSDAVYASLNGTLYKIDKSDGKILWKSADKINTFYLSQSGKDVVVIKNSGSILSFKQALNILNASNGNPIWKDDIKTKYIIYLEDWSDRILVAHNSGFNFYNYADGKKIWKNDAKGNDIQRVIPIEEDYLYIADKEMNLIDKNGNKKWKKTIEISDNSEDPVYYLDKIDDNHVLYLTGTYGNMVDYTSGKKVWKKNIEFEKKKPVLYAVDEATQTFMVYNDKKVYKFDVKTAERPNPIAKLKDTEDDKTISNLELFDWGISLVGQCDVIGVTLDGETKYHNTYKEPGGGKRKFLGNAGGLAVGALAVYGGIQMTKGLTKETGSAFGARDANGKLISGKKDMNMGFASIAGASVILETLGPRVSERFNALKQNNEYAFVFAKGANGPQLVKVRKADGVEVEKIDVDNNKPLYEVDPVTDNVYYAYKNELRIFSKK